MMGSKVGKPTAYKLSFCIVISLHTYLRILTLKGLLIWQRWQRILVQFSTPQRKHTHIFVKDTQRGLLLEQSFLNILWGGFSWGTNNSQWRSELVEFCHLSKGWLKQSNLSLSSWKYTVYHSHAFLKGL